MSEIFKKLLLKKETPFLSKIVHFRHKMAWISEKKAHSQKPQDTCLIIYHKEVPPADWAKSKTHTPDHHLVSYNISVCEYGNICKSEGREYKDRCTLRRPPRREVARQSVYKRGLSSYRSDLLWNQWWFAWKERGNSICACSPNNSR